MRLDHLLSKEHTPRCQANVLARMVVFTSGIVDGQVVRASLSGVGGVCGTGLLFENYIVDASIFYKKQFPRI